MLHLNLIFELFLLTFSIVYIIDSSGFITSLSQWLWTKLNPRKEWLGQLIPKPFSCSLCFTFWTCLIYSLFYTSPVYSVALASLMSLLTIAIRTLIYKLNDFFYKL